MPKLNKCFACGEDIKRKDSYVINSPDYYHSKCFHRKEYTIGVNLKFTNLIIANSKKEAIELIKENFYNDFNIELTDKEIKIIK